MKKNKIRESVHREKLVKIKGGAIKIPKRKEVLR